MKCVAALPPQKNSGERGVRGERKKCFPQLSQVDVVNRDDHYRPLPPPPSTATPEERELHRNQEALRRCLFRLKWGHPELAQYIAEQFEGRRFYQLNQDEVTLLIYRLQTRLVDELTE